MHKLRDYNESPREQFDSILNQKIFGNLGQKCRFLVQHLASFQSDVNIFTLKYAYDLKFKICLLYLICC